VTLDAAIVRVLLAVARRIDAEGLTPEALARLERAGVELAVDWHPTVADGWRATVRVGGRAAPLVVDEDAACAAARALRAAVIHGVGNDRPRLVPAPVLRGPFPHRPRRAK
jgi:hypothetical protein